MNGVNPVLARKLGRGLDGPDATAGTGSDAAAREMQRALLRAADRSVSLCVTVTDLSRAQQPSDQLIAGLPGGWLVLGLCEAGQAGLAGLVLLDPALRSAVIEVQTLGIVSERAEQDRPVTATDAALAAPFIAVLLEGMTNAPTPLCPAGLSARHLPDLRAAGLMLREGVHDLWRIDLHLGGTEREGKLCLVFAPPPVADPVPPESDSAGQGGQLRAAIADSPAQIDAVLGQLRLSLAQIEAFDVGQVIALPGISLASVTLTGPGDTALATARLGQMSGLRAVRLEAPGQAMTEHGLARPAPRLASAL